MSNSCWPYDASAIASRLGQQFLSCTKFVLSSAAYASSGTCMHHTDVVLAVLASGYVEASTNGLAPQVSLVLLSAPAACLLRAVDALSRSMCVCVCSTAVRRCQWCWWTWRAATRRCGGCGWRRVGGKMQARAGATSLEAGSSCRRCWAGARLGKRVHGSRGKRR